MKISRKPTPPPRPAAPSRFIQPFVSTKTANQILTKANRKQLQLRSARGRTRTPRPGRCHYRRARNFDVILDLLQTGENIEPTEDQRSRVVQRGLEKKAPFHRSRNSDADAWAIASGHPALRVGDAVGLTALFTFMSLVFWTWVIGPLGALLAVPLTLLARALLIETNPRLGWALPLIAGKAEPTEQPKPKQPQKEAAGTSSK